MKSIILSSRSREKKLHIEAPGCIVSIQIGLTDCYGHAVTSINVLSDGDRYTGDPAWWLEGVEGNGDMGIRVVCEKTP